MNGIIKCSNQQLCLWKPPALALHNLFSNIEKVFYLFVCLFFFCYEHILGFNCFSHTTATIFHVLLSQKLMKITMFVPAVVLHPAGDSLCLFWCAVTRHPFLPNEACLYCSGSTVIIYRRPHTKHWGCRDTVSSMVADILCPPYDLLNSLVVQFGKFHAFYWTFCLWYVVMWLITFVKLL